MDDTTGTAGQIAQDITSNNNPLPNFQYSLQTPDFSILPQRNISPYQASQNPNTNKQTQQVNNPNANQQQAAQFLNNGLQRSANMLSQPINSNIPNPPQIQPIQMPQSQPLQSVPINIQQAPQIQPMPLAPISQMSDINAKTNISSISDKDINQFLNNLGSYEYNYIDPKYGDKTYYSPMAQELEKSKIGASAIETNDEGYKMVNYGRLQGINLALAAHMNNKISFIEAKLKAALNDKFLKGKK